MRVTPKVRRRYELHLFTTDQRSLVGGEQGQTAASSGRKCIYNVYILDVGAYRLAPV